MFERLAEIEWAAVRGWPALESEVVDGWVWRSTSGGSVRANSVAALAFTGADLERAIDRIEDLYRSRAAPVCFTISEVSQPAELDAALDARGYVRGDDHVTMAKHVARSDAAPLPLAGRGRESGDLARSPSSTHALSQPPSRPPFPSPSPPGGREHVVQLTDGPSEEWMKVYLSGISPDRRGVAPRLLAGLPRNAVYLGVRRDDRIVASGLTIIDGALASVQCMAVVPESRRRGAALDVLAAIERHAAASGADLLYLQTGSDNLAARALYAKAGFWLAGRYHTRIKRAA